MYTRLFIFRIVTKISGKQKFPNFWEFIRKFGKTEIAKFPEFEFSENLGPKGVSSIRTPDVIGRARETAFCLKLRTLKTNKDLPTLRVSIHPDVNGRGARDRFLFKTPDFENKKGPADIKGWRKLMEKNLRTRLDFFSFVKNHLLVSSGRVAVWNGRSERRRALRARRQSLAAA